jgi:hypothetical protein
MLLLPASVMIIAVRQFLRRRWLDGGGGTVVALLVSGIVAASLPLVRAGWDGHAHRLLVSSATANGVLLDNQFRPVLADCGTGTLQGASTVALVWRNQQAESCRAADVYVNGLATGRWQVPDGSVRKPDDPWWITNDGAVVTAVIPLWRPASRSWQVVGLPVQAPHRGNWKLEVRANRAGTDRLEAVRWKDLLVLEAASEAYLVDMHTGHERPAGRCPAGRPFAGLGPAAPDRVAIICGDAIVDLTG